MPRVFIGVPTFNRPRYLRETLASVRAQTFADWRVVVSDNASPPESARAARALVEELKDPRIAYVLQTSNGGEYGQGRFFLGAVRDEEFFIILHDDDLLRPGYLEQAVAALTARAEAAYYVADPVIIDQEGIERPELTAWYLDYHARRGRPEGWIDVLKTVLHDGLTPICGTCFRTDVLRTTGLVDPDLRGNYPFELNVLLRIGERGHRAWYSPRPSLAFRFHPDALRADAHLLENPAVVHSMLRLLERRRFAGPEERRRRVLVGRLHRARAVIALRHYQAAASRDAIRQALSANWCSIHSLLLAPLILASPALARRCLPGPRRVACPPTLPAPVPAAIP